MAPSIAIVGGGLAGLCLARLLQISGVSFDVTVFELDASPDARAQQGGTLDLHPDGGQTALKKAGLWDEFHKVARYESQELTIADKNATAFVYMKEAVDQSGVSAQKPEIDREQLKDILLRGVHPDSIKWGKKLVSVEDGTRILKFADNTTAGPFDLIVGADGTWSKTRSILTDVRPAYSGVAGYDGYIVDPDRDCPRLSKWIGPGNVFCFSDGRSMTFQRMSDRSVKVLAGGKLPEFHVDEVVKRIGRGNDRALSEEILTAYTDWHHDMKTLVRLAVKWRTWNFYELPIGHRWEHKRHYTMVGDAAHVVTPFAGQGVNAAMHDTMDLCDFLVEAVREGRDIDEAVIKYEEAMFPRAKEVQTETMFNKQGWYAPHAPASWLAALIGHFAAKSGFSLDRGVLGYVPIEAGVCYILRIYGGLGWIRRSIGDLLRRQ